MEQDRGLTIVSVLLTARTGPRRSVFSLFPYHCINWKSNEKYINRGILLERGCRSSVQVVLTKPIARLDSKSITE